MTEQVTIIGAGIVGICCALSLQERGIPVRLVDRGEPGQETSFGNAGVVSPWSIIPQAVPGIWKKLPQMLLDPKSALSVQPAFWPKMIPWGLRFLGNSGKKTVREVSDAMELLCRPSIDLYRRHLQGTGHEDLIADSYYVHAFRRPEQADLEGLDYLIRQEKGGDLERVDGQELRRLEPALSSEFKAAVLIKGQARVTSPGRVGAVLAEKARQQGAEIVKTEITGLTATQDGDWHLSTPQGTLNAHKVILAAGVWSAELLKPLRLSVPLVAERGYHVEFPTPAANLNNSVMDVDAKVVASSMADGLRVAGTAEFAKVDAPIDPRKEKLLTEQAKSMVPDLDTSKARFWMGRRPSFPDSLPAIGQLESKTGLYAAFGHSHYGLMMAPKTGELVADLVSDRKPNINLAPYSPNRF
ncbi:D-amino acid dehydrogenase small subunit [Ruegeria denitrificans]|uniref:D-amino acid dehydrogenase small subunit n=1 Tax=Ruegeria denitrificans TaxID=1715692 RepID=A0A0P1I591_9RHOB|nr:FAD-binding oxidoreductase [Ruegeria denitrificans]CUJ91022.1 D-amino acid dehydrogenase small subunit [Ruegeria denitrificans]